MSDRQEASPPRVSRTSHALSGLGAVGVHRYQGPDTSGLPLAILVRPVGALCG